MSIRFTHLVLSGGSVKCLTSLGALKYHDICGHLSDGFKVVVGSSAGALIGLFLVLGYDIESIIAIIMATHDAANAEEPSGGRSKLDAIFNIADTFGMNDGQLYVGLMERAIDDKLGAGAHPAGMTFAELKTATGRELVVCVTNLTDSRSEFWSAASHPDVSVVTAVRASISVPLLFTPVIYEGKYYVDGGVTNNFPLAYITSQRDLDLTIAIQIVGRHKLHAEVDCSLLDFLRAIINTCTDHGYDHLSCHTRLTISVDDESDDWDLCGMCMEDMKMHVRERVARKYVQHGYNVAKSQHALRASVNQRATAEAADACPTSPGT